MNNILEVEARQPFVLRVDSVDHNVEYPVTAVARLEKQLGRGMRSLADWLRITAEELPAILEAGLERSAPTPEKAKEIAEAVCATLSTPTGGEAGGSHYHLQATFAPNVQAFDSQGVEDVLDRHSDKFQRHMEKSLRKMNR